MAHVALPLRFASKFIMPFDFRNNGDESHVAKMCQLQEVWAAGKGPLCEILSALFCVQRKTQRQRFIWELKRQSRERGEHQCKRQSDERGEP